MSEDNIMSYECECGALRYEGIYEPCENCGCDIPGQSEFIRED